MISRIPLPRFFGIWQALQYHHQRLQHLQLLAREQHTLANDTVAKLTSQEVNVAAKEALLAAGISKLLVANRGEIACRVISTARRLGLTSVAVFSDADRAAKHVKLADEAHCIGGAAARDSYLKAGRVLEVAQYANAQAIHPGYGFLSENADFAEACEKAGISFVGPPASAIRSMGDKAVAKAQMASASVPVVPGYHGNDQSNERLMHEAEHVGFPLLVKAVSGGGGKGMKLAATRKDLPDALESARRESLSAFGDDRLLLERYVGKPRHVEVQVVADKLGNVASFFDRDCSVQRRHQKVLEEAPAPGLSAEYHAALSTAARRAALAAGYTNAGTVEFILDMSNEDSALEPSFFFMEMNTRLQVEHPVTEAVTGMDLVALQLLVAAGGKLPVLQQQQVDGHAFEARLYAESPDKQFLPGAGRVEVWQPPSESSEFKTPADGHNFIRVDSGIEGGDLVGTHYDPMIAKIIVHGSDRHNALATLRKALEQTKVAGLPTNLQFLQRLCAHPAFIAADLDTGFLAHHLPDLLTPQPIPVGVAALAGVARHLMQCLHHAPSTMTEILRLGAWAIPDSKRLWYSGSRVFQDVFLPTQTVLSSNSPLSSSSSSSSSKIDRLVITLTMRGQDSFNVGVEGMQKQEGEAISSSSSSSSSSKSSSSSSSSGQKIISVEHAQLTADSQDRKQMQYGSPGSDGVWKLEAEVEGCRMQADVVQFMHGRSEMAMCMWVKGCPESFEFRWPVLSWSRGLDAAAAAAAAPGSAGGKVIAPMPGKVAKVLIQDGDKVVVGQGLLALEAMKMEHVVVAPKSGIVVHTSVFQDQQVSDGEVLMRIEDEIKIRPGDT